jgi:hypothetical protein
VQHLRRDERVFVMELAAKQNALEIDPVLAVIVGMADIVAPNDLPHLTLLVGGTLVSGRLMTARDYQKATGFNLSEKVRAETADHDPALFERDFVHLSDAQFYGLASGPTPANRGVLWRGSLRRVDGFHFGRLVQSDNDPT